MRFIFICDPKDKYSGWTIDQNVYVNCAHICNQAELLDTITHEAFHAVMNALKIKSTEKEDHYILARIETEWF